jgi:hypothetical protein
MNLSQGLSAPKPLVRKFEMLARIVACRFLKHALVKDLSAATELVRTYWHPRYVELASLSAELRHLEGVTNGIRFQIDLGGLSDALNTPFVYERHDADHLVKLREAYGFDRLVASSTNEYEAMVTLATWLGQAWDHGKDTVPGSAQHVDLIEVMKQGKAGKKFWCEIAAKVGVQAFTSMGWPARLVTTSRDGYTWEHAVFETWSNTFGKWFALDTDFNILYEADGIPLSAYEICHQGPALMLAGKLKVRKLGPPKASLPFTDLLPFFSYVHIDLRSDWYTRRLSWGSPAGGDYSTWWTARADFPALLTPKVRQDDGRRFDWPMNAAWMVPDSFSPTSAGYSVKTRLLGYAPYFKCFQVSIDGGEWKNADGANLEIELSPGDHMLSVRVMTESGETGNPKSLGLHLPQAPGRE